jgi:uncharacterized peroxidase-related enzyme
MSRFQAVTVDAAEGSTKAVYDGFKSKLGMVPNLVQTMAISPAVVNTYAQFNAAMGPSTLSGKIREQISLVVGEANGCDYCLSAHSAIGQKVGLKPEQITAAREGHSTDPKTDAVLKFSQRIVETRGKVSDQDVEAVRAGGVSDSEIAEVVAFVALNIFTNYFNNVAQTEIDFPKAQPLTAEQHV